MDRRRFVAAAALAPLALKPLAAFAGKGSDTPSSPDSPAAAPSARSRMDLTLHRVLESEGPRYSEQFLLADLPPIHERRFIEYSGDLSGRYIGALATLSLAHGTPYPALDILVEKAIALQKPDGYFGATFRYDEPTDAEMALLWGNGRLLVGLLEYWKLHPSAAVLNCARRLGDFLVRVGPLMLSDKIRTGFGAGHFASSYICWMQQTEGLALLYAATKDDRYLQLAAGIAQVIELRPSDHVHGCLTAVRGVLELYRATGDSRWLDQCETAWKKVADGPDALITGGVPEGWSPNGHRTEGCGEADWLRLSLGLWHATGKPVYLEAAERNLFNEFSFNQYSTGDYGHRHYTDTGLPSEGAIRAWWCCTLHGLRAFPDVEASVFRPIDGGLSYDLPVDGDYAADGLKLEARSSLARDGRVRLRILEASSRELTLQLRRPFWATDLQLDAASRAHILPQSASTPGSIALKKTFRAGEEIELQYKISLRTQPAGSERLSFWVGPWLLGMPYDENPAFANELPAENRVVPDDTSDAPVSPGAAQYAVPIAARSLRFVSAEFPDQPARVTLRAIAEQTGRPTTSWELRLLKA